MLQKATSNPFDLPGETDVAWCPGCGNFPMLQTIKKTFVESEIDQEKLVLVSGIGQAAKLPQYINCSFFNGLHGRALPVATGIKAANPELTVVVTSGDGDIYGEGGNHFIHTVRRNPDITVMVHNNMIYGLTKGQASPTSETGLVTPTQPQGVYVDQINPLALAISLGASFVGRANAADPEQMKEVLAAAIAHEGFALVDVFQACIVYNKVNTYEWFKEKTYTLEDDHDVTDRTAAFARATETERLPLGIFYQVKSIPFEKRVPTYVDDARPLYQRESDWDRVAALIKARTV